MEGNVGEKGVHRGVMAAPELALAQVPFHLFSLPHPQHHLQSLIGKLGAGEGKRENSNPLPYSHATLDSSFSMLY